MAVAPGNSSDNLDDNDALLLDDNLSISVEGLYAFLDEQPFDPVADQSQSQTKASNLVVQHILLMPFSLMLVFRNLQLMESSMKHLLLNGQHQIFWVYQIVKKK
ncbi:hypothetical protein MUK42_37772 [Musa troglodytarum]|uniref:Uncharacterized protein n=1 Tax=Musa troglodytarum TaxID=320322 RepID=A0A9E7HCI8_9LILI|nr:hypothetical protein MUK42_37772 [Musa troglodytarum]